MNTFIMHLKQLPLWATSSLASLAFILAFVGIGLYSDASLFDFTTNKQAPVFGDSIPDNPINSFLRYDSNHYRAIATNGYTPMETAFFPLYPLLVKGVSYVTSTSINLSLFIISFSFLIASAIVLAYWLRFELKLRKSKLSPWAVMGLIALFPTSFYMALGYSESLFVFISISALFAYRKGYYWLAALAILLATATRVQGGALAIFFLLDYVFARKWSDWKKLIPVVVAPLGLIAYMVYLWVTFGNPFEFIVAQQNWGRLNSNIIGSLISSLRPPYLWYLPVLGAMLWAAWKYLGKTWFIYCLIFILIPLLSGRLDSLNRYMLALPPLFLALALYLESKPALLRTFYIITSVFLLAWSILLFMNGYWVA